jgi:hypothetical protein
LSSRSSAAKPAAVIGILSIGSSGRKILDREPADARRATVTFDFVVLGWPLDQARPAK